jgi:hypothetical protein
MASLLLEEYKNRDCWYLYNTQKHSLNKRKRPSLIRSFLIIV